MEDKILKLLIKSAKTFNKYNDNKIDYGKGIDTTVYGKDTTLDSVELVDFIVQVEEKLEDELGIVVNMTSEKAMSRKVKPFHTFRTMTNFIMEQIGNEA